MNNKGNSSALREYNKQKTLDTRASAMKSIDHFRKNKIPITYNAISKHSGITRKFLYNDEEISILMKKLVKPDSRVKRSLDSKDVIIQAQKNKIYELEKTIRNLAKNDNYKEKYDALLEENTKLKKQLRNSYTF